MRIILLSLITLATLTLSGCGSLFLSGLMGDEGTKTEPAISMSTLDNLRAQQPSRKTLTLTFADEAVNLDKQQVLQLVSKLNKSMNKVAIKVGPVSSESLGGSMRIAQNRGGKVKSLLEVYKIPAKVAYEPSLKKNTLELEWWLM